MFYLQHRSNFVETREEILGCDTLDHLESLVLKLKLILLHSIEVNYFLIIIH